MWPWLVLLVLLANGGALRAQTTNGLWGYWSFDNGTATDLSGNSHHGTTNGGIRSVPGRVGSGFEFNGTNTFIDLGNQPRFINVTISAWIQIGTNSATSEIVDHRAGYEPMSLYLSDAGGLHFKASYHDSPSLNFVYRETHVTNTNTPLPGKFYHLAMTYDGSRLRLYEGGQLVAESLTETAGGYNSTLPLNLPLLIGAQTPGQYHFKGVIDEVRIYSRALSNSEIRSLLGPVITNQPHHTFVLAGSTPTLSVQAVSETPLSYRWRFHGTNLSDTTVYSGAFTSELVISNVQPAQVGFYSVLVSNIAASVSSSNAFLTISVPGIDDDGDGLSNTDELRLGTNPFSPDSDGDTLTDHAELFIYGTNPLSTDTDGDGMTDEWEIANGLNPLVDDAGDDLDLDRVSNLQEYQNRGLGYRPARADSLGDGRNDYERLYGTQTNRFYYDRTDRLVGADYNRGSNGFAIGYVYDGNGNLLRQKNLARDANHNGLPDLWEFLHGLTNNASTYADSDGDGWTDYQEWKADTSPTNFTSRPGLLDNPGLNIASLTLPFTPSNFVVGVGQLDGSGAEEIVIGADGNPGTNTNFLLVLTQGLTSWSTQRVDVGSFGITSVSIGQVTNRSGVAIYVGLRSFGGTGRISEFLNVGGVWQSNAVVNSTNGSAFVLGCRDARLLGRLASTNAPEGALLGFQWIGTNWVTSVLDASESHRGLGRMETIGTNALGTMRLLDNGGVMFSRVALQNLLPTNAVYRPVTGKWYFPTPSAITWLSAQAYARSFGGNLVTIESGEEDAWVRASYQGSLWNGLNCDPTNDPIIRANWKWISGSLSQYRNWAGNQPNGLNEYYNFLDPGGTWNNTDATDTAIGIVEVREDSLKQILPEPSAATRLLSPGWSLASGILRTGPSNAASVLYSFIDDKNTNRAVNLGDEFVTSEYFVSGTNVSLLTLARQPVASFSSVQSYGLASVNFLNQSNEVFFTGEPDGQVFAWTATGSTNPLQRQLFSAQYAGKGWHALAAVKTFASGEGLAGLLVDPVTPNRCDVIFWPPQTQLPQAASFPQTAPLARVLPTPSSGGNLANVRVRIWDAEGNASLPLLQFSPNTTNWFDVTNILTVDGAAYSLATRVSALPGGSEHTLVWNAGAAFPSGVTNIFLRTRAKDISLLGDWSEPMPYQLTLTLDSDGDGLPDDWEIGAFGNITAQNGDGDADGDGFKNSYEYLAGTNPNDPTSSLRITLVQPVQAGLRLDWMSGTSGVQVLQSQLGLGTNWFNLFSKTGGLGGTQTFTVTNLPPTGYLEVFRIKFDR